MLIMEIATLKRPRRKVSIKAYGIAQTLKRASTVILGLILFCMVLHRIPQECDFRRVPGAKGANQAALQTKAGKKNLKNWKN